MTMSEYEADQVMEIIQTMSVMGDEYSTIMLNHLTELHRMRDADFDRVIYYTVKPWLEEKHEQELAHLENITNA